MKCREHFVPSPTSPSYRLCPPFPTSRMQMARCYSSEAHSRECEKESTMPGTRSMTPKMARPVTAPPSSSTLDEGLLAKPPTTAMFLAGLSSYPHEQYQQVCADAARRVRVPGLGTGPGEAGHPCARFGASHNCSAARVSAMCPFLAAVPSMHSARAPPTASTMCS